MSGLFLIGDRALHSPQVATLEPSSREGVQRFLLFFARWISGGPRDVAPLLRAVEYMTFIYLLKYALGSGCQSSRYVQLPGPINISPWNMVLLILRRDSFPCMSSRLTCHGAAPCTAFRTTSLRCLPRIFPYSAFRLETFQILASDPGLYSMCFLFWVTAGVPAQ